MSSYRKQEYNFYAFYMNKTLKTIKTKGFGYLKASLFGDDLTDLLFSFRLYRGALGGLLCVQRGTEAEHRMAIKGCPLSRMIRYAYERQPLGLWDRPDGGRFFQIVCFFSKHQKSYFSHQAKLKELL